eukprot:954407-Alexandrium_andersonii.AAC.1
MTGPKFPFTAAWEMSECFFSMRVSDTTMNFNLAISRWQDIDSKARGAPLIKSPSSEDNSPGPRNFNVRGWWLVGVESCR